ncbi:MAG: stage V sporulation protein E, partial [Caldithrix sp.]|nr:stage V sporulation protein E [Caldithrix sp.]
IILLAGVFALGITRNGATRWYSVLGINFQPSELAKIAVVIYLASFLAETKKEINNVKEHLFPLILILGLIIGLIIVQPDFSTSMLLALIAGSMLFISPLRLKYILSFILALLPVVIFTIMRGGYQAERIKIWLAGLNDPMQASYQIKQSLIGLGRGGWLGHGLGNSRQKLQFLPDSHTDFIFSIIGEELGLLGTSVVMICFFVLMYRGFHIARKTDNAFGKFLAIGITLNIVYYGIINASVVSILLPPTGLPMPFLSYGGSHLLFVGIGVGILLNISRQTETAVDSKKSSSYRQRREQMYRKVLTAD